MVQNEIRTHPQPSSVGRASTYLTTVQNSELSKAAQIQVWLIAFSFILGLLTPLTLISSTDIK